MAGADIGPSVCNRAVLIAREAFWYVRPDHRKGVGKKLLIALECAVKNHGAMFFDMVAEVGKRDLPLARVYEAGGFSPAERIFRKRLG
jgi:GNAT superfamily N-acetyltransferase